MYANTYFGRFFSFLFLRMCCAQQFITIPDVNKSLFFVFVILFLYFTCVYRFYILLKLVKTRTGWSHSVARTDYFEIIQDVTYYL